MEIKKRILGLGELLWDVFPDRRNLGGAPANVAYHANILGDSATVLTRVGNDALGDEAIADLEARGVVTDEIQRDDVHPTGTVAVSVHAGEVSFAIQPNVAWAFPEWTAAWELQVKKADAVCFGTLQCASAAGRHVIEQAAQAAPPHILRLLDLNLRPPFDTPLAIDTALSCANVVKLSEDEAHRLAGHVGIQKANVRANKDAEGLLTAVAEHLLARAGMRAVAVTFGARGSALYTTGGCVQQPGQKIVLGNEADPVGAGDAFTAALLHHLVRGHTPARACAAANHYGGFVASCAGAMPMIPTSIRTAVRSS